MGNTTSTGASPHQHNQGHHQHHSPRSTSDRPARQEARRRPSLHALPPTTPKATAAPPSASLESAVGQSALTSVSPSQPRDVIKPAASRERSASSAASRVRSRDTDPTMGSESSKAARDIASSAGSRKLHRQQPPPVQTAVPASRKQTPSAAPRNDDFQTSPLDPSAPPTDAYNLPPASYWGPPRLPLAIDEEVHTPGSPILSAVETAANVPTTVDLNRRASVISSNVDDEEEKDEFQTYMPDVGPNVPKVPTLIEWREAGTNDRVYVTGTFADWERKYRLHWNGPSKHENTLSAILQLPPGTHHVKFLVNNDMQVASHLPTTVDYTNILVNYIEVASNKVPSASVPTATAPTPIPSKPLDIRPKQPTDTTPSNRRASANKATSSSHHTPNRDSPRSGGHTKPTPSASSKGKKIEEKVEPPKFYTNEIPAYLLDLDVWPIPSDSPGSSPDAHNSAAAHYRRANKVAMTLPEPPSLPLFLNKSILNQNTPMKDDSSVLILPNHTVLNHLSTTNIKNGVLATSATSRYKQRAVPSGADGGSEGDGGKFLTTILYKPRSEDD